MKLRDCILGQIVVAQDNKRRIGHIVGLAFNYENPKAWENETVEIIPVVKFVGEQLETKIHYANIEIFTAY
jgi:hypothetical protein